MQATTFIPPPPSATTPSTMSSYRGGALWYVAGAAVAYGAMHSTVVLLVPGADHAHGALAGALSLAGAAYSYGRRQKISQVAKLQSIVEARSAFIGSVAHVLRNGLHSILGVSEMLSSDRDGLSGSQAQNVELLGEQVGLLGRVLYDILDIARLDNNKEVFATEPFHLEDVLRPMRSRAEITSQRCTQITASVVVTPAAAVEATYYGDCTKILQCTNNLFNNAIKYTETGSVKLIVDVLTPVPNTRGSHSSSGSSARYNAVSTNANGEQLFPRTLSFTVVDTGVGISSKQIRTVFDKFDRAGRDDSSHRRRRRLMSRSQSEPESPGPTTPPTLGNTGLGLAIVKRLVFGMGGSLGVTSASGQGSRFWFTIPMQCTVVFSPTSSRMLTLGPMMDRVKESPCTQARKIDIGQRKRRHRPRPIDVPAVVPGTPPTPLPNAVGTPKLALAVIPVVLAVDDEMINLKILQGYMKGIATVITACNGKEAIAQWERHKAVIRTIFMDIKMPVIDGVVATKQLRRRGCNITIVATTANIVAEEQADMLRAGMNKVVTKPYTRQRILECL